jgi:ABC-type branched-subunit amino acid transport system substrate-binding protein
VFLPLTDGPSASIVAAMKADPELAATPIIVSEFAETPAFLAALGPLSDGVYGSNVDPSTLGKDDFYTQEFIPAYNEFVQDRLPLASTQATFDAVNLSLAAIRHVAEPTPDGGMIVQRQALRDFMLRVSGYPGLSGPLECTPLGDCVRTARMAIYQAPQWPIVSPTAEPVYAATLNLEEVQNNRLAAPE